MIRAQLVLLLIVLVGCCNVQARPDRGRRSAADMRWPVQMWPLDQTISYKFIGEQDADLTKDIRSAFKFWTDNTCLTYQENGSTIPLIQVLKNDAGLCSSWTGRKMTQDRSGIKPSPTQDITMDPDCASNGTLWHEIAHSMGIQHTMKRWDRDDYLTITENLKPSRVSSYIKLTEKENNNFGIIYDYTSVMHYGATFSSINGKETMLAKEPLAQNSMGLQERVAFSDIKMINLYYNCAQKCPSSTVKCQNGGIINSKKCESCICPFAFTGSDCSKRHPGRGPFASKPGCGADLTASASWQSATGSIGESTRKWFEETECFWNVQAPVGKLIEVRLKEVTKGDLVCSDSCEAHGVEVFPRGLVSGGYRLCCVEKLKGQIFKSKENVMPVRLYAKNGKPVMNFEYRMV